MRNRLIVTTCGAAAGLRQPGAGPDAAHQAGAAGRARRRDSLDFGVRVGSDDGDEARFERYRDLRPGASTLLRVGQEHRAATGSTPAASNIGYRDQRYSADYYTGKLAVSGVFDSIPLNYLYDAPLVLEARTATGGSR